MRLDVEHGRLVRVVDRGGTTWAELAWDGDRLVRLAVPGAVVDGAVIDDPLLGPAHAIVAGDRTTAMSVIDWARPSEIPAIAAPGRLPPHAGGALLNVIAQLAAHAGVTALRYAGPYPTPALWRALARSFRTTATEDAFTRDAVARMARRARDPIAIDFAPAPHDRLAFARGHAELRGGIERVVIDGVAYEPGGSPARLAVHAAGAEAQLWFGDVRYAQIASLGRDGAPSAIEDPPRCHADVIGRAFPPPLVTALAELIADAVPAPLAADARGWVAARTVRWADLGARAARLADDEALEVHAAL